MKDPEKYRKDILNRVKQDPIYLDTDEDMWEKVLDRISDEKPEKKSYFVWYAAAVVLFMIATAGIYLLRYNSSVSKESISVKMNKVNEPAHKTTVKEEEKPEFKTKVAENIPGKDIKEPSDKPSAEILSSEEKTLAYTLKDGSEVTLNAASELTVKECSGSNCVSDLSGEAYFAIAPDKERTFRVNFGSSYLVVVGTQFNVRNLPGDPNQQIAVTEGIVKVYPYGESKGIEVKGGELMRINSTLKTFEVLRVDPLHYISWKTGKLVFKKTSLDEVAQALNRVYHIQVVLDKNIKKCTFTGDLSQTPLEEALQLIEVTTSLKITRTKDNVHISGSPCK